MKPRGWRIAIVMGLLLGLGGLASGATRAAAQTGAAWPQAPTEVSTYRSVEECLGALDRLTGGLRSFPPQGWPPLPDTVRATVARCLARYTLADPALTGYPLDWLLPLFLVAQRDSDAAMLVAQRTAALPATDTAGRREIEETLLWAYRTGHRRVEMLRYLEEPLRRASSLGERWLAHEALADFAWHQLGDTALQRSHLRQLVAEWEQRPPTERGGGWSVFRALRQLRRRELLDSLAHGTASYLAALNGLLDYAWGPGGAPPEEKKWGLLGQPAPAVVGDFWFRRGPSGSDSGASGGASLTRRPVPGQVNLVVFLTRLPTDGLDAQWVGFNWGCGPGVSATLEDVNAGWCGEQWLVPLAQRFPALAITLVTRTMGTFAATSFADPAQEAERLRQWMHEGLQLPGVLAVTRGPATRAPAADRRVRHQVDANERAWPPLPNRIFLVDRAGKFVKADQENMSWDVLADWIEATLRQPAPQP